MKVQVYQNLGDQHYNIKLSKLMQATSSLSTKQRMFSSASFKLLFIGTIICGLATLVFGILQERIQCNSYYENSCSGRYSYQCSSEEGDLFCCYGTEQCGYFGDCFRKVSTYYGQCTGLVVSFYICLGLFLILTPIVFFRFYKIRRQTGTPFFNEESPSFSSWLRTFRIVQYKNCPCPEDHHRQYYPPSYVEPQFELQRQNLMRSEQPIKMSQQKQEIVPK